LSKPISIDLYCRTCCRCLRRLSSKTAGNICEVCRRPPCDTSTRNSKLNLAGKPLTNRETHIIRCLVREMPNKSIAHELGLTEGTVKIYLLRIYRKLGVGRIGAVKWGMRNGFDDAPSS
jgi:DNA-binding NarL/FixJ family response regulator